MSDHQLVQIRAGRLLLRPVAPQDKQVTFMLSQEAGMRAWLPDQVYSDEAEALDVLSYLSAQCVSPADPRRSPYVLGVCLATSQEVIGHVGFSPHGGGVEVGFAIGTAHQGRGYAKQAVSAATSWALGAFGLSGVLGIAAQDNVSSCRILEACGFQLQAVQLQTLQGVERIVRTYRYAHAAGAPGDA